MLRLAAKLGIAFLLSGSPARAEAAAQLVDLLGRQRRRLGIRFEPQRAVSSSSSRRAIAAAGVPAQTFGPSRDSMTARIGTPSRSACSIAAATRSATAGSPGRA
jgi:hypothetical protein